jgi:hypothetical protein
MDQIFENIKDNDENINTNHLFLFLLSIVDLYEYYLYSTYKKEHKNDPKNPEIKIIGSGEENQTEEVLNTESSNRENPIKIAESQGRLTNLPYSKGIRNTSSSQVLLKRNRPVLEKSKTSKGRIQSQSRDKNNDDKEKILKKIKADIKSKVNNTKKYCSFDNDGVFIISFENSKIINRDFFMFYINWSNHLYKSVKSLRIAECDKKFFYETFKPEINPKSAQLFSEFRRKINSECIRIFYI